MTDVIDALIRVARRSHAGGSLPATSGNFSARLSRERIAITASGRDKGALTAVDFGIVDLDGCPEVGSAFVPSAETPLHCSLYGRDPAIGAVLHTHGVAATVLSRKHRAREELRLEGYELAKAFEGQSTHATTLILPIFAATQDMMTLSREVDARLGPNVPGYLVEGHGMTTWGKDVAAAARHLEALDFLLICALEQERLG